MPRFLSAEWLDALGKVVAEIEEPAPPPEDGPPRCSRLALGQLVTGGPDGDVGYTILLGSGISGPRVLPGTSEAEVVLAEDYETARALAAGERTSAEAMAEGLVKVRGDAKRLVACEPLVARLAGAVSGLQAETTF